MGELDGIHGFATSNATVESTVQKEKNVSVAQYASLSTDLDLVNISKGKLTFYEDGKRYQVEINDGWKFSDINSELARQGSNITLSFEDGFLKASSSTNAKVQVGATNDGSNFLAITGISTQSDGSTKSARELYCVNADSKVTASGIFRDRQNPNATAQVTEGTFKVGDATITVDSNSTLSDIMSQINSNSDAAAYAYWDNVKGEMVIESTKTGSAFVNVEEGSSNFTYIMGLTTREDANDSSTSAINIDAQTLGSNARFTINGTSYTASSNHITEDISRIKGVTMDLKDASEGQVVKLKIERDKETLANAVADVVDSYNTLMENVNDAVAKEGQLHKETGLKALRDQIYSMMSTLKIKGCGISVQDASASNVSTSSSTIYGLKFDKTAFMNKFTENQEAMKELLVGLDGKSGIFSQLENTIWNSLTSGYFTTTERTYNKNITNLNEKITKANKAVERYRTRIEAKFKSMDMLIAQMQQQYSSFLKS